MGLKIRFWLTTQKSFEETQGAEDEKQKQSIEGTALWKAADAILHKPTDTAKNNKKPNPTTPKEAVTNVAAEAGKAISASITKAEGSLKIIAGVLMPLLDSILASTISIYRFKLRGSLELMVGGKDSSTPWYLTIGNPYSPWIATNHIIVKSASVDTSPDLGFNDQPQWLKVTFNCQFSRSLGKQELMRMFNNSFRRTYSDPSKVEVWTSE